MADFRYTKPAKFCVSAIPLSPTIDTGYPVPVKTRVFVKDIDIANTTTASIDVTVYLVPSGGTAGTGNMLIPGCTIPAKSIFQWTGSQILNEGDTVQFTASAVGCTIHCSGAEAI